MALAADNNLGLPVGIELAENGWNDEYNDAMNLLDAIVHLSVKAQQNAPGTETLGFRYLVGASGSGAWAGQSGKIAIWRSDDGGAAGWKFITPKMGWLIYDETANIVYVVGTSGSIAVNGRRLRPTNAPATEPLAVDPSDPTKELRVALSGIATATARTLTMPDKNVTAMSSTGDTMTGELNMGDNLLTRPLLKDYGLKNIQTTDAVTSIDLSNGNAYFILLGGNITTLAFTNWPDNSGDDRYGEVTVAIKQGGAGGYTVSWDAAVYGLAGSAPTITTTLGKTDILKFRSFDGGTVVFGEIIGQNY